MPGSEKETDPWLFQLGPQRTTLVWYMDRTTASFVVNRHQSREPLPQRWTGETKLILTESLAPRQETGTMHFDGPTAPTTDPPTEVATSSRGTRKWKQRRTKCIGK